ncbi:hypothetical protein BB560_000236 [Smittium megazygosporum]|uniref:Uncharacterized protein n=1 Tax=Smittium megazygosporum TaxID=133381 RepID=A0A2T9ZL39_9FUNG|nr:hypothetical protein BB560_000236 [Smittium megazygosporum]
MLKISVFAIARYLISWEPEIEVEPIRIFVKPITHLCSTVDSITRYIKCLSELIKSPEGKPIPKARAIGATLASASGVHADKIVSHAFWSSYSIFDSYYQLSRCFDDNLTESILALN